MLPDRREFFVKCFKQQRKMQSLIISPTHDGPPENRLQLISLCFSLNCNLTLGFMKNVRSVRFLSNHFTTNTKNLSLKKRTLYPTKLAAVMDSSICSLSFLCFQKTLNFSCLMFMSLRVCMHLSDAFINKHKIWMGSTISFWLG